MLLIGQEAELIELQNSQLSFIGLEMIHQGNLFLNFLIFFLYFNRKIDKYCNDIKPYKSKVPDENWDWKFQLK